MQVNGRLIKTIGCLAKMCLMGMMDMAWGLQFRLSQVGYQVVMAQMRLKTSLLLSSKFLSFPVFFGLFHVFSVVSEPQETLGDRLLGFRGLKKCFFFFFFFSKKSWGRRVSPARSRGSGKGLG